MSTLPALNVPSPEVVYPSSDGKRMAENTLQAHWIVLLVNNLNILFAEQSQVFVACDLLWYPVAGEPAINQAPDVMVVFGRPKGHRPSWLQFREDNIPPQVVFEILSPSNDWEEMADKLHFYDTHGVEEYYVYNPDKKALTVFQRRGEILRRILPVDEWVSPRLQVRFDCTTAGAEMKLFFPDGQPFLTAQERALQQKELEKRLRAAEARNDKLAARLRELGLDPDV